MSCKSDYWVSLQLRPVGDFCNLACKYCEYGKALPTATMSDKILYQVIKKLLEHNGGHGVFCWHGGEPTLAGLDFFERAVNYQNLFSNSENVINQIQTNATNLHGDLIEFFARNKFSVGISLDGQKLLHNTIRVNKGAAGTYDDVIKGVGNLRDANLSPSVICTVSKIGLSYASETFRHLISLGFKNISYNVVFQSPDKSLIVSSEEWYEYLRIVFHEWCSLADESISVREINEVISWMIEKPFSCCSSLGSCAHWVVIDNKGDMFPCEVMGKDRKYGNILHSDFGDLISLPQHKELVTIVATRPTKCQTCEFEPVCNNGCTQLRTLNGSQNKRGLYAYCAQRLQLFHEVKLTFGNFLKEGGS